MDALYIWMVENGFDPALVAYIGGAIALLLVIKMFFFQKKNIAEITEQEAKETAQVEEKAQPTVSPDASLSELPVKAETPAVVSAEISCRTFSPGTES